MNALLQRLANALAYGNVGSVGALNRKLNAFGEYADNSDRTRQPASAEPAADAPPAAWHAALEQAGRQSRAWTGTLFERFNGALDRHLHLPNPAYKDDLITGITVALVTIPQSLACAQLAGVPAYYGLYASFVPTIVATLAGSSVQLSTGPTALSSLLTAASIAPFAAMGSQTFIADVILLSLIAGTFQIIFGVMRLGRLLSFLSHPVLMGFINAAAMIIGLSQLPALLGMPSRQSEHFMLDIWHLITHAGEMSGISFALGMAAVAMLAACKYFAPRLPGVLFTIIVLTAFGTAIGFEHLGGSVVGEIPRGLPPLEFPTASWETVVKLVPAAFVLALISFMEAMSSAKIMAIRHRQQWDQNRELIGQGLAKVAAAFCHSMPVSGSFSRSAVNATAHTRLASIVSAVVVVLTLLLLNQVIYYVPKSALAAIVILSVVGLIDFRVFRTAWRAKRDDGIAVIGTFAATLGFAPNVQNGIIAGTLLSLGLLLYRMMRPRVAILGVAADGELRDAQRYGLLPIHPELGAVRFDGSLHFVTGAYFEEALTDLERTTPHLRYVLVQSSGINDIDATGIEVLRNLGDRFRRNGIVLTFSGLKHQARNVLERTGLVQQIGEENIFNTDHQALAELKRRLTEGEPPPGDTSTDGTPTPQQPIDQASGAPLV